MMMKMNRAAVVVSVLCLVVLGQAGWAADLQAGWYVKLGLVALWGRDPGTGHEVGVDWNFTGGLGTFGPFEVSGPDMWYPQRMVSVPSSVTGVAPSTSVYLWGEPSRAVDFVVSRVSPFWDTYYDGASMRLELLMYGESTGFTLLWSQTKSGVYGGAGNVLSEFQSIPIGHVPVFRVTTVPEAHSLFVVGYGLLCAALFRKTVK
jgi:hypothetical protein